jgi:hypothetical protein
MGESLRKDIVYAMFERDDSVGFDRGPRSYGTEAVASSGPEPVDPAANLARCFFASRQSAELASGRPNLFKLDAVTRRRRGPITDKSGSFCRHPHAPVRESETGRVDADCCLL